MESGVQSARYDGDEELDGGNEMLIEAIMGYAVNNGSNEAGMGYNLDDVKRAVDSGGVVTTEVMRLAISRKIAALVKLLLDAGGNPNALLQYRFGALGGGRLLGLSLIHI